MRGILRDFAAFLIAVLQQWVALMGGMIMTIIYLVERQRGNNINPRLYWSVTIGFIALATFLAWRRERQKWQQMTGIGLTTATPREIIAVYEGHTSTHGDALAKTYRGKWLRVSGLIRDINIDYWEWFLPFTCTVYLQHEFSEPFISLRFGRRWARRLSALQQGDQVEIIGKILWVQSGGLTLWFCEIVGIGEAKKPNGEAEEQATLAKTE